MQVRDFSDAFLDDYLERNGDAVLSSVGCYQLEGEGIQLFDAIAGDYFTILGLPLLPLLGALRDYGINHA
jgi:septum formation protein